MFLYCRKCLFFSFCRTLYCLPHTSIPLILSALPQLVLHKFLFVTQVLITRHLCFASLSRFLSDASPCLKHGFQCIPPQALSCGGWVLQSHSLVLGRPRSNPRLCHPQVQTPRHLSQVGWTSCTSSLYVPFAVWRSQPVIVLPVYRFIVLSFIVFKFMCSSNRPFIHSVSWSVRLMVVRSLWTGWTIGTARPTQNPLPAPQYWSSQASQATASSPMCAMPLSRQPATATGPLCSSLISLLNDKILYPCAKIRSEMWI